MLVGKTNHYSWGYRLPRHSACFFQYLVHAYMSQYKYSTFPTIFFKCILAKDHEIVLCLVILIEIESGGLYYYVLLYVNVLKSFNLYTLHWVLYDRNHPENSLLHNLI